MNWYKKISKVLKPGETIQGEISEWGFNEAIRLFDGRIIYDEQYNHWDLFYKYIDIIKDIKNVESIGYLETDGVYSKKYPTKESQYYLTGDEVL